MLLFRKRTQKRYFEYEVPYFWVGLKWTAKIKFTEISVI